MTGDSTRGERRGRGVVLTLPVAAIVVTAFLLAAIALPHLEHASAATRPLLTFRLCASALFLAAGILRLARWQVTSRPHNGFLSASMLVLGALTLPLGGYPRSCRW